MTKREIGQAILTGLLVVLAVIVGINSALDLLAARKRAAGSAQNQVRGLWGQNVPTFEAVNLKGERLLLPDPQQPTVAYFFSTKCGACAVNREQWDRLAQSVPANAKVIALAFEAVDTLQQYVRSDSEASATVVPDVSQFPDTRQGLRMWATPTLYVFDSSGVLRYSHVGVFNERTAGEAIRALDSQ
jgi:peroxiredoxin